MKNDVLRAAILGLLVTVAGPSLGINLYGVLYTGSYQVVCDSVWLAGEMLPVSGWGADSMSFDTALIAEPAAWPRNISLYSTIAGELVRVRVDSLVEDTWYMFGLPPTDARVKFAPRFAGAAEATAPRPMRLQAERNPTAGPVRLAADLPQGVRPIFEVYDGAGLLVRRLNGLVWDRRDGQGRLVTEGVYLVRLIAGNRRATTKVVLTE